MSKTCVSVIIPTYNNSRYIGDALRSVFSQSYDSYEVIVVDDGSTDGTSAALEPYLRRIQYVRQDHFGVASARNLGLSMAGGKYVVFLDGDDLLLPKKLLKQAAFLDRHPEIGLVHSGWYLVDENGKIMAAREPWHSAPELDLDAWLVWQPIFLGAMMIRRSWLEKTGGFDTNLTQASDVEFLLRLAVKGCPASWLKRPTVYYRQHGSGLTSNSMERVECVNKVISDFFSQQNLPESARLLEKKVRYQISMWSVWLLYRDGNGDQVVDYLRKTLAYVNGPPRHIMHGWLLALIQHCRADRDYGIEELQRFWPYFKKAMPVEGAHLAKSERLFHWLIQSEAELECRRGARLDDH